MDLFEYLALLLQPIFAILKESPWKGYIKKEDEYSMYPRPSFVSILPDIRFKSKFAPNVSGGTKRLFLLPLLAYASSPPTSIVEGPVLEQRYSETQRNLFFAGGLSIPQIHLKTAMS